MIVKHVISWLNICFIIKAFFQVQCVRSGIFAFWHLTIWVLSLSLHSQNGEASLFEVNIRYVGGLLAAYYLTGEEVRLIDICYTSSLVGFPASFIPSRPCVLKDKQVCGCVRVCVYIHSYAYITFQLFLYCYYFLIGIVHITVTHFHKRCIYLSFQAQLLVIRNYYCIITRRITNISL